MTKKELYKATKDIGFREYAIGLTNDYAKYHQYLVNSQRIIHKNTVVQAVHVELGLLITKYFLFVPKLNITLLIKHGVDNFDEFFDIYTPNYNTIWDSVNGY